MVCSHFPMFICSDSCVFVCYAACKSNLSVLCVCVCGCVNVLIQWCEAAGLWLSVEQHSQRRQNYTQFKCRFGHLAKLVQNGATTGGPLALNCARVLLQALVFLRTILQYVRMRGVVSLSKCEYVVVFRPWIFSHVTGNVSFWSVCKQVYMRTRGCACK